MQPRSGSPVSSCYVEDIKIDLSTPPSRENLLILASILSDKLNIFAGEIYFDETGLCRSEMTSVSFTHNVFRYPCDRSEQSATGFCYQIQGKEIGNGSFGTVYDSVATLVPQPRGGLEYRVDEETPYVIKIQHHQPALNSHNEPIMCHTNALREYEMFKASKREIKQPVEIQFPARNVHSSVTIMRKLGEYTLSDLRDAKKFETATTAERLAYSLAVLRTYKKQVADVRIVHRDIKPSNIRTNQYFHTDIVDYGMSKLDDEKVTNEDVGTSKYASPEALRNKKTSTKSDIYALSYVLGQIWGADSLVIGKYDTNDLIRQKHENYQFNHLFQYTSDLAVEHQMKIRELIVKMHDTNPANRPTIDVIIRDITAVIQENSDRLLKEVDAKEAERGGSFTLAPVITTDSVAKNDAVAPGVIELESMRRVI